MGQLGWILLSLSLSIIASIAIWYFLYKDISMPPLNGDSINREDIENGMIDISHTNTKVDVSSSPNSTINVSGIIDSIYLSSGEESVNLVEHPINIDDNKWTLKSFTTMVPSSIKWNQIHIDWNMVEVDKKYTVHLSSGDKFNEGSVVNMDGEVISNIITPIRTAAYPITGEFDPKKPVKLEFHWLLEDNEILPSATITATN
jgi:hypothetical protein